MVVVLIGVQVITHDMGPLLIACYGAGAFVAASIAMWWHERSGARFAAFAVATALFVAWILGTTFALFELGSFDDTTAARLENLAAPLASANDQLALVTWFQRVSPPAGFGVGAVPWCGHASAIGLPGRAGADPERLHVDGARRRVRLDRGVGGDDRLRDLAASADTPPSAA